ncbi:MAG: TonB-dependent receptor [Rikenellaceae bacterium]
MKKIALLVISLFVAASSFAAEGVSVDIVGHVLDAKSGNHIPYATITIVGTTLGAAADGTGHYNLKNVEAGEYIIEAVAMGYSPIQKTIKVDRKTKNLQISFSLDEDIMSMDQVVVSSTRSATLRRNSPNLVSMLSSELFETVNATTLADGLPFQSGVRVEDNCQNCGFTQVRINGLDGHYSQIMVDSRPTFSALTGVYGLEHIPANMIDRVEVVRGGGSALYGSSAIGGTINIITKTPEYNSAEFSHTLKSIGMSGSLDNNTTASASIVSENQKAGLSLFAQSRQRSSYDANDDGFTEIPEIESQTFGLRSYFKTSDFSRLNLQYDATHEFRRGGDNLDLPAHSEGVYIAEQVEHLISNVGVSYDIFSHDYKRNFNIYSTFQDTKRDSYYGGGGYDDDGLWESADAYGTTNETLWVSGAQLTQKWDNFWFMPAVTIGGLEYNYNNLQDIYLQQDWDPIEQRVSVVSAYLQNEWTNDKWGILVGGRADYNDLLGKAIFSPRFNLRYNPSRNVNLRATYSTGFRAPQVFDEDLHIAVNNGELIRTIVDDDLVEETSQSVNISADLYKTFGSVSTNFLIEGFYTHLDNVFITEYNEEDNYNLRRNGGVAVVKGVTLEAKAALASKYQFQMGATIQESLYSEPETWSSSAEATDQMFRTPDLYGYFTATYNPSSNWTLALTGTYTGSMLVEHMISDEESVAETTPDFWDVNFKVTHNFTLLKSVRSQVFVSLDNIFNQYQNDFDEGAERDAGYIYGPIAPRSFSCGVKFMF